MDNRRIDILNMGLMVLSLVLAFLLPFELFLFSYAVLGPLHYLTEISWLHKKNYFVPGKGSFKWFAISAFIIGILVLFSNYGKEVWSIWMDPTGFPDISDWGTNLIFTIFGIAFILVLTPQRKKRLLALGLLCIFSLAYNLEQNLTVLTNLQGETLGEVKLNSSHTHLVLDNMSLNVGEKGETIDNARIVLRKNEDGSFGGFEGSVGPIWKVFIPNQSAVMDLKGEKLSISPKPDFSFDLRFGHAALVFSFFLPTLIHVFLFTGLFMLFGALKSNSSMGLYAVGLLLICALLPFLWNPDFIKYSVAQHIIDRYDVSFYSLNLEAFRMLKGFDYVGNKENARLLVYGSPLGISITRFIAFAYTYHYLNWFSKTSIIQWHKVPYLNLGLVIVLWLASVSLYMYDYRTGLQALFFLSFLHVFLEFPLNIQSIKGIIFELLRRYRGNVSRI